MEDASVDVVVLASGINRIPLAEGVASRHKALIPFAGRPSLHYVLEALLAVPAIRSVCIEGPSLLDDALEDFRSDRRVVRIDGGETFLESLVLGLTHFSAARRVLFITADLPLVTSAAICAFLTGCDDDADGLSGPRLYVSAVPKASYTGAYTHFTKPFNRYRDVSVCHGNLFLTDPRILQHENLRKRIDRFYAGRKNAVATTLALGWKLALVYMLGVEVLHALTLGQMARFASHQLGIPIVPVLVPYPEISLDVDEPDDYDFVRDRIEAPCR
jgi:CTP:molybdopterin cytidylyltransferase MocA